MKILLLNDDFPPTGQSSVGSIVEGLVPVYQKAGHIVTVLTSHRPSVSTQIIREGNVISLPIAMSKLPMITCLGTKKISAMLENVIAELQPDVIHAHNLHSFLTFDALRIARRHTNKVFLTLHDVMSFSYSRLNTEKFLNEGDMHWTWIDHLKRSGRHYNPWRLRTIRKIITKNVTTLFVVSNALKKAAAANGLPEAKVIYNGIDVASWHVSKEGVDAFKKTHQLEGRKTILFGGRLSMDKGSGPVLDALEKLSQKDPSVLLLIVGDPRRWEDLQKAAPQKTLEKNIRVLGWLNREEMRAATFAADVVTSPSLCLDCFPTLNLEAMAAKKPVVGTIFGGTPEVVEDGVTGFVCDPRETEKYAGFLEKLLNDEALNKKMGEAGYERVKKNFTIEKQVEEYLKQV